MVQEPATVTSQREAVPEPLVGIVILAWNHRDDTLECLRSVDQLNYSVKQVLLVDNGSTDGTKSAVRERFPTVQVIETGRNLGVPAGYNVGIREALARASEHILILNNDVTVAPDMLRLLVDAAEVDPTVGVFMPKILHYAQPGVIWSTGARYRHFPPAIVFVDRNRRDNPRVDRVRPVAFAPACGLLVRRDVFEKVGLFDPGFFFFYEDWDLCERVRAAGMSILSVPSAHMWHKVSRSTRQESETYWRVWGESSALFYRRYGGPTILSVCVHIGYLVARELARGNVRSLPTFCRGVQSGLSKPLRAAPRLCQRTPFGGPAGTNTRA